MFVKHVAKHSCSITLASATTVTVDCSLAFLMLTVPAWSRGAQQIGHMVVIYQTVIAMSTSVRSTLVVVARSIGNLVVDNMTKNDDAIKLLDIWLTDKSGYDEKWWPIIKKMIEENRLSNRKRFSDNGNEELQNKEKP